MTIPKRTDEVLEEQSNRVRIIANTGPMRYKTGGVFAGLLVEAMVGDDRVGYLTAEKRGSTYVMDGVYVEPEYRQNGIATDMVRKAHETVPMTPYILTENQVYQSEIGKKIAINEYRMVTASTIVTAGPLLAVPELLGAGEAIAGAGEAAAGAGEAAAGAEETGGMGSMMKNMPSMGGGSKGDQQQGDQQQGDDLQGQQTVSPAVRGPANPIISSFKTISFQPMFPSTTVPMELPSIKPWTINSPATKGLEKGYSVQAEPEVSREEETVLEAETKGSNGDKSPQSSITPSLPEPEPMGTKQDKQKRQFNLSINSPQPIVNVYTPANPRSSSANKLFELIIEDQNNFIDNSPKRTTWE